MTVPVGYQFLPTEEQIIKHYLFKKTIGENLPSDAVLEFDLYGPEPPWKILTDDLPWVEEDNGRKKNLYVFTSMKYVSKEKKNRLTRKTECGSWMGKSTGKIVDKFTGDIIGKKGMLVFESNDEKLRGMKGHWSMHEFSLAGSKWDCIKGSLKSLSNRIYVVCKITKDESKTLKILPLAKKVKNIKMTVPERGKKEPVKSKNGKKTVGEEKRTGQDTMLETVGSTFSLETETMTNETLNYPQELEKQATQDFPVDVTDDVFIGLDDLEIEDPFWNLEIIENGNAFLGLDPTYDFINEITETLEADEGTSIEFRDQPGEKTFSLAPAKEVASSYKDQDCYLISEQNSSFGLSTEQEKQLLGKRSRPDREFADAQINKKMRSGDVRAAH